MFSCTTERKVNRYLDNHYPFAINYCAKNFPITATVDTVVDIDTSYYETAYNEMWAYTEKLLERIDDLEKTREFMYIPVKENKDSLWEVLRMQLRKTLKPCKDTVRTVIRTIEDKARVQQLMAENSTLNKDLQTFKAMAKIRLRFLIGIAAALFVLIAFQTRKYWL